MTPLVIISLVFAGAILGVATFKIASVIKEKLEDKATSTSNKRSYEHRALHSKEILHQEIEQITKTEPPAKEEYDENVIEKDIERYL